MTMAKTITLFLALTLGTLAMMLSGPVEGIQEGADGFPKAEVVLDDGSPF